jgi:DNA-binding transcriptional MerR regulator
MVQQGMYTLKDLCDLAQVTPRTVRYYISEGLLRSPGAGPGAKYDEAHLARLRLIRRLQREHLPLAEIRNRLRALSDDDVRDIVSAPPPPPADSAADYIRGILAGRGVALLRTPDAGGRVSTAPRPVHPLRGLLPARKVAGGMPAYPGASEAVASALAGSEPARAAVPAPPAKPAAGAEVASDEAALALKARAAVREIAADYEAPSVDYEAPSAETETAPEPPRQGMPERSQWERISLTPDLELHVRRPLSRVQNRQLTRLLQFARELLEEERP